MDIYCYLFSGTFGNSLNATMSGKKRNRFWFFVEEIVRDLKQDGLSQVNWGMVNNAAGDREWQKLSDSER